MARCLACAPARWVAVAGQPGRGAAPGRPLSPRGTDHENASAGSRPGLRQLILREPRRPSPHAGQEPWRFRRYFDGVASPVLAGGHRASRPGGRRRPCDPHLARWPADAGDPRAEPRAVARWNATGRLARGGARAVESCLHDFLLGGSGANRSRQSFESGPRPRGRGGDDAGGHLGVPRCGSPRAVSYQVGVGQRGMAPGLRAARLRRVDGGAAQPVGRDRAGLARHPPASHGLLRRGGEVGRPATAPKPVSVTLMKQP